jgi:hypothetical protein
MTTEVAIPVDDDTAKVLQDPMKRQALGHLISRWIQPDAQTDRLLAAMGQMAEEAKAAGLTAEQLDAELAVYNAERRG